MKRLHLALALCVVGVTAAEAREDCFRNYDGDTFRATFRIANIDAPEIEGKCDQERKLAIPWMQKRISLWARCWSVAACHAGVLGIYAISTSH
jgi:hypothetical protein